MTEWSDRRAIASGVNAVTRRARELMDAGEYGNDDHLWFDGVIPGESRWVVDTAALPEVLAAKVVARQRAFGSSSGRYLPDSRVDPSRASSWAESMLPAVFVLAVFAVVSLAFGLPRLVSVSLALAPSALLLVFLGNLAWQSHGQLSLSPAEAQIVREHATEIDPCRLSNVSLIECRADALQIAALEAISAIGRSPAWKSEHCDLHRIELNLTEEAYQVTESCMNLAKLGDTLAEVKPTGTSSSDARRQLESTVAEYETLYARAEKAVIDRIAALYAYKSRLAGLEALISDIEKTSTLARRSDSIAKAFEAIVRDEYAAATTRKLAEELADLQVRLQTELAFISGQIIDAPALVAPLTRADGSVRQPGKTNPE